MSDFEGDLMLAHSTYIFADLCFLLFFLLKSP